MTDVANDQVVETIVPDKLYFKIGEVAEIIGVKPYVLRYWETEFPEIAPSKSKSKQRLYRRKEVEMILLIRDLLYKEKFTIEGARNRLKELQKKPSREEKIIQQEEQQGQMVLPLAKSQENPKLLLAIKEKMTELLKILENS